MYCVNVYCALGYVPAKSAFRRCASLSVSLFFQLPIISDYFYEAARPCFIDWRWSSRHCVVRRVRVDSHIVPCAGLWRMMSTLRMCRHSGIKLISLAPSLTFCASAALILCHQRSPTSYFHQVHRWTQRLNATVFCSHAAVLVVYLVQSKCFMHKGFKLLSLHLQNTSPKMKSSSAAWKRWRSYYVLLLAAFM